jgi:quinol monooxygenase YgiN
MRRNYLLLAALAFFLASGALAVREPRGFLDDVSSSLQSSSQAWVKLLSERVSKRSREEESYMKDEGLHSKIFAIKYYVPPSMSDEFEDHWMKMEDKEDNAELFALFGSYLDNIYYYHYSEFEEHKDLHEHLTSSHFNKFAEMVDECGIKWELDLLTDLSNDLEDKYRGRETRAELMSKHKKYGKKEMKRKSHVIIEYKVDPEYADEFMEAWMDCAEKTFKNEKDNMMYSLRKVSTDNTGFQVWGAWENMGAYFEHLESGHWKDFVDFVDKKDIKFFITPLEKI